MFGVILAIVALFLFLSSGLGSELVTNEGFLAYPWNWYHPYGYRGYRGYYGGRRWRRRLVPRRYPYSSYYGYYNYPYSYW